jgi:hypothetical protein
VVLSEPWRRPEAAPFADMGKQAMIQRITLGQTVRQYTGDESIAPSF